ncbi:MAG TPA: MATE family efflux transporter [Alphaproteobacteria bacterium]|nr:MATE family efflux transporter [Alphaproteobacteria bacterium]
MNDTVTPRSLPSARTGAMQAAARRSAATERILEAPILPTLARLAAPNVVLVLVQTAVSVIETWLVGRLGTVSLAALALVFPFVILMQMMSAGSMGGGVSSAVARALGAKDVARAETLIVHALVIALAMALGFTVIFVIGGRPIFRALGADDAVLQEAVRYATVIFGGAFTVWTANMLASVVRGSGNMLVPSAVLIGVAAIQIPLAAGLTLGLGPFPRLGLAGAGLAQVLAFGMGAVAVIAYLASGRGGLRLRATPLRWRYFADILRVGGIACISSLQAALTVTVISGFVAGYGTAALAGYGIGTRLEFMQVPLIFAVGATLVAMVGANVGAGNWARARRIAWTGGLAAAALSGAIGITTALLPALWVSLFTDQPAVVETGAQYLRIVGPFYGFLGLGFALYFASQGMARVIGPVLAGTVRLLVIVAGGFAVAAQASLGVEGLFAVISLAMLVFGAGAAIAVARIRPAKQGS